MFGRYLIFSNWKETDDPLTHITGNRRIFSIFLHLRSLVFCFCGCNQSTRLLWLLSDGFRFDFSATFACFLFLLGLINDATVEQNQQNRTDLWVANWVIGFFHRKFLLLLCLENVKCYRNFLQTGGLAAVVARVCQLNRGKEQSWKRMGGTVGQVAEIACKVDQHLKWISALEHPQRRICETMLLMS